MEYKTSHFKFTLQYAQAVALSVFLKEARLVRSSELPLVEAEEFLAGVLGFTEELSRCAWGSAYVLRP